MPINGTPAGQHELQKEARVAVPLEEWLQTHCLTTMQTGAWEGPDSWCYRIRCIACDYSELAHGRDEAWEIYRAHKPRPRRKAVKPRKVPRGGTRKIVVGKRVIENSLPSMRVKTVKVKWEEKFF